MYNAPQSKALSDFSLGWDLSTSQTALDPRALSDCLNINLILTRGWENRGGLLKLMADPPVPTKAVTELYEYAAPDGNRYVLSMADVKLMLYPDGAAWKELRTGLTAGKRTSFISHGGYAIYANGTDANGKVRNKVNYQLGISPPAAAPTTAEGAAGAITGRYKYLYRYRRTTPAQPGNPSPVSAERTVTAKKILVTVVASAAADVDKIDVYRTFALDLSTTDPDKFFYVGERANTSGDYEDNKTDAELGFEVEYDNTVPPKAKFMTVYRDQVFYANCPDETDGTSLVMYSKRGKAEAVPSTHYEYFDRGDGQGITGIAALPDCLVVFKKNRLFVVRGEFEEKVEKNTTQGIGCIAPWAILTFEDKIIFLAEEGWYAFDGLSFYLLSKRINRLIQSQEVTYNLADRYSAVFYPAKSHFQFLCNHSSVRPRVFVGHFVTPLLFIDRGIPEEKSENIVGWTYHQYPNHTLTCLAKVTDPEGITRIIAGASNGYVYQLDSGTDDDGLDIPFKVQSGWFYLGKSTSHVHTLRQVYLSYSTDKEDTAHLSIDVDFLPSLFERVLTGTNTAYCGNAYCGHFYCGVDGGVVEKIKAKGTGVWFRYNIFGENQQAFAVHSLTFQSRFQGVR